MLPGKILQGIRALFIPVKNQFFQNRFRVPENIAWQINTLLLNIQTKSSEKLISHINSKPNMVGWSFKKDSG